MFTNEQRIFIDYEKIRNLILTKKYKNAINMLRMLHEKVINRNVRYRIQVMLGIALILDKNEVNVGWKYITQALKETSQQHKPGMYEDINKLLFGHLRDINEYGYVIHYSALLLNNFKLAAKSPVVTAEKSSSDLRAASNVEKHESSTLSTSKEKKTIAEIGGQGDLSNLIDDKDIRFLSKLYIAQGEAYKILNNAKLAKDAFDNGFALIKKLKNQLKASPILEEKKSSQSSMLPLKRLFEQMYEYNELAVGHLGNGELENAIVNFEKVLDVQKAMCALPTLTDTTKDHLQISIVILRSDLGGLYNRINDNASALRQLTVAVDECINNVDNNVSHVYWYVLLQRGLHYLTYDSPSKVVNALTDFEEALKQPACFKRENSPYAFSERKIKSLVKEIIGQLCQTKVMVEKEKSPEEIIRINKIYLQFIKGDPGYSSVASYFSLYLSYYELNQYEEALSAISLAIQQSNEEGSFYLYRAEIYKIMNDLEKASIDLEMAKQLLKTDLKGYWQLKNEVDALIKEKKLCLVKSEEKSDSIVSMQIKNSDNLLINTVISNNAIPAIVINQDISGENKHNLSRQSRKNKKLSRKDIIDHQKKPVSTFKKTLRAQKKELNKMKDAQVLKNRLHEQVVLYSKQIVRQLIESVMQMTEEKERVKKERYVHSNQIVNHLIINAMQIAEDKERIKKERHAHSNQIVNHLIVNAVQIVEDKERKKKERYTHSNQIVYHLLANAVQIVEDKEQAKKAQEIKLRQSFQSIVKTAAMVAYHKQLRNKIMTPQQFLWLCIFEEKIREAGAILCVIGSNVPAYMHAKKNNGCLDVINRDIDLQIRGISMNNKQKIFNIIKEDKFEEDRFSNEYSTFKGNKGGRKIDITLVLDEKKYDKKYYDPIDITRCRLILKRDPGIGPYFDFNEKDNKYLLEIFLSGHITVDLMRDKREITCLFMRMIKYSRLFHGILKLRISFPNVYLTMNESWSHPQWIKFLEKYFDESFHSGKDKGNSSFKEIDRIIQALYLDSDEVVNILYIFFQRLLTCDQWMQDFVAKGRKRPSVLYPASSGSLQALFLGPKEKDIAAENMIFLLKAFYKGNSAPLKEFCYAMVKMFKRDRTLQTELMTVDKSKKKIDNLCLLFPAEKAHSISVQQHGMYGKQAQVISPVLSEGDNLSSHVSRHP